MHSGEFCTGNALKENVQFNLTWIIVGQNIERFDWSVTGSLFTYEPFFSNCFMGGEGLASMKAPAEISPSTTTTQVLVSL